MMTRISWRSRRAYDILTTLERSHVIIHVSFFNVFQELYGPTKIELSFRKKARTISEVVDNDVCVGLFPYFPVAINTNCFDPNLHQETT
jgi:hypothetical protein